MAQQTPAAKRAHKEYVNRLAEKVRAEIDSERNFLTDQEDDFCVSSLKHEAREMSDIILRALIAAFKKVDGTRLHAAVFNGTLDELEDWERELVDEALRERQFTQLKDRAIEFAALVTRAEEILVANPFPIGSGGAAYEIRNMIRGIELDDQDMIDEANAQFGCEAEEEPEYWYPTRERAMRDARRKQTRR
jgi:hypothetical protein